MGGEPVLSNSLFHSCVFHSQALLNPSRPVPTGTAWTLGWGREELSQGLCSQGTYILMQEADHEQF